MGKRDNQGQTINEQQYMNMAADSAYRQSQAADATFQPLKSSVSAPVVRGLAPSTVCRLCNSARDLGQHEVHGAWEKKWSTHWSCANTTYDMLDRKTGIVSDRR